MGDSNVGGWLKALPALHPDQQKRISLPALGKTLTVEGLTVPAPRAGKPIVRRLSLKLEARQAFGPSIGYLPQDVQLSDCTVAENITRLSADPDAEAVLAAARSNARQILARPRRRANGRLLAEGADR